MAENKILELKRKLEADPNNLDTKIALLHAQARVEGPKVYREFLEDRLLWNRASKDTQDLVIEGIARSLQDNFSWLETRPYSCNEISHRIATFVHEKSGMEFCLIPGGTYLPGTKDLDEEVAFCKSLGMSRSRYLFELESQKEPRNCPPLMVGRFPVIQKEWDIVGGSAHRMEKGPNFPVVGFNWIEVRKWLSNMGKHFRLPREIEWEYLCRGGSVTRFFWGDLPREQYRLGDAKSGRISRSPFNHLNNSNAFGLVDMVGAVYQWCEDTWIESSQSNIVRHSLRKGQRRAIRGGSWFDFPGTCRSAHREKFAHNLLSSSNGFRVVRSI